MKKYGVLIETTDPKLIAKLDIMDLKDYAIVVICDDEDWLKEAKKLLNERKETK